MKKILALAFTVLVVSATAAIVFAPSDGNEEAKPALTAVKISASTKVAYKNILRNYFKPFNHGYGIGFTEDTYLTAKWYIVGVRTLSISQIREVIGNTNASDWSQLREEVQSAIQASGVNVTKGRIVIGKTAYVLTNIQVTNTTASADIRETPDYISCKEQNVTAEDCESNASKIGDMSLTKKTGAVEDVPGAAKVWAGALNFKNVAYSFVTFAYPRGER